MIFRGRRRKPSSDPASLPQSDRGGRRSAPANLHRLIYTSEAWPPGEPEDGSPACVQEIADDAARRNAAIGLSGVLVSVRGHFIQILEGDLEALEMVFEFICRDMRHRALALVDLSPANERLFEGRDMVALDTSLMEDPEPFEDLFLAIRSGMASATIVREARGLLDGVGPGPQVANRTDLAS